MSDLYLRKAKWNDVMLLFKWANDEDSRRNSFHVENITLDKHCAWFRQLLKNAYVDLYILCKGDVPVGQVRLECDGKVGILSYSIVKEYRGKGMGSEIIRLLEVQATSARPCLNTFQGDVKIENIASQRILERNGYVRSVHESTYIRYTKRIKKAEKMCTIGIRVDANDAIATGHAMRCMSIAEALLQMGRECIFIVADGDSARVTGRGAHGVAILNTRWDDMEGETGALTEVLRAHNVGVLLVDSYAVTVRYLEGLRALVKTAYIDDMNTFIYPTDLLINYNVYADQFDYPSRYSTAGTKLLIGCNYAPLRAEFLGIKPKFRNTAYRVLVTMGGSDSINATGQFLETLAPRYKDMEFHVVVGELNVNKAELTRLAQEYAGIVLHQDIRQMSELMVDCDVAVTAGGSTLYELCACGIPSITVVTADNQMYAVREFEKLKLMPYSGDIRKDPQGCLERSSVLMHNYIKDSEQRRSTSIRMKKLVDGHGALRIAQALVNLFPEKESH